jgi:hypothetical protein
MTAQKARPEYSNPLLSKEHTALLEVEDRDHLAQEGLADDQVIETVTQWLPDDAAPAHAHIVTRHKHLCLRIGDDQAANLDA